MIVYPHMYQNESILVHSAIGIWSERLRHLCIQNIEFLHNENIIINFLCSSHYMAILDLPCSLGANIIIFYAYQLYRCYCYVIVFIYFFTIYSDYLI